MDLGLDGKIALVTAASKGLGRAVARELAKEGAEVVIISRNADNIQEAARSIQEEVCKPVVALQADVGRAGDIKQVFNEVKERFGRLDVLVANSGGPPSGTLVDFDDGDWEDAFVRNLLSVVRLVRSGIPLMKEGGRIAALTSSSVRQPVPGLILSNVMRAGVSGLVKTLAEELAEKQILVNTVAPGRIATDRVRELDAVTSEKTGQSLEAVRQRWESKIPLGRYADPEEFARVVTFLVSWANTYLTGQVVLVDGGMVRAI